MSILGVQNRKIFPARPNHGGPRGDAATRRGNATHHPGEQLSKPRTPPGWPCPCLEPSTVKWIDHPAVLRSSLHCELISLHTFDAAVLMYRSVYLVSPHQFTKRLDSVHRSWRR